MTTDISDTIELKRLAWQSRRGMLELDVLLTPFLEEVYPGLPKADQENYKKLIDCEDQDMFSWFMQTVEPEDPEINKIIKMILKHRASTHSN